MVVRCSTGASAGYDQPLDLVIGVDVGTPEAVDRLLGIAHHEQGARSRLQPAPVLLALVLPGEVEHDLSLDRVSILKLVDQQVGVAILEVGAHLGVLPQQAGGVHQQVLVVESGFLPFQLRIMLDCRQDKLYQPGVPVLAPLRECRC